jgi:hypothetical protein
MDKSVKIWDIRSKIPLQSLENVHQDRILTVKWGIEKQMNEDAGVTSVIATGGVDNTLKIHSVAV